MGSTEMKVHRISSCLNFQTELPDRDMFATTQMSYTTSSFIETSDGAINIVGDPIYRATTMQLFDD